MAEKKSLPLADVHDKRLLDLEIATSPDEDTAQLSPDAMQELEASLKKRSKAELIAIILGAARLVPEVTSLCSAGDTRPPKDKLTLVKEVRKALRKALEVPDFEDYEPPSPDYEPVRKKLEILRVGGFPAEVLDMGLELIEDSKEQIEMIHDDYKTYNDIAQCMPIVLQALRDVDWPLHKKLLWAFDAILIDGFSVCEDLWDILHEKHTPEAWGPVADALLHRIRQCKKEDYSRGRLIDMATHALSAAGHEVALYALYAREAVEYGDYMRLVKYLLKKGDDKEAEEWIHKGIAATEQKKLYPDRQLRSCLLDLRTKQKDWDAVLCMQTEDFVYHASLDRFHECQRSAEKLKVWPVLRPLLMDFLIERALPWKQEAWPCRNQGRVTVPKGEKHPDFSTLIDVAIHEKNPADVLKWYDLQGKSQRRFGYHDEYTTDKVASAVQDFAPERAIALWKKLAEQQIAIVNPKAYVEAGGYLRKAKKLMNTQGMTTQWNAYIQSLRTEHRRKIRLMDVLDTLSPSSKQAVQGGQGKK